MKLCKVYSFRAECAHDVEQLAALLRVTLPQYCRMWLEQPDRNLPDVQVEMQAPEDTTFELLLNTMRMVPDGHVMVQTLRPVGLDKNSLERDYKRN